MGLSISSKKIAILVILAAISFAATVVCVINTGILPYSFKWLSLLPLGNTIITVVLVSALVRGVFYYDIPIIVIATLFTARNAITPLVMSVTTCSSRFGIYSNAKMINIGIAAFLYETAAVYLFLNYFNKKSIYKHIKFKYPWHFSNNTFYYLLSGGIVLSLLSFIFLPELRTQYYTIFTTDITHLTIESASYTSGIKRALATSANMIIEATRLVGSSFIIVKLRKIEDSWKTYFGAICVILLQFLFINDSNAYVIMIAFALYMLVYKLFPRYGKLTLRYLVIIVLSFFILIYINRFSRDVYGTSLSYFLQAYLPGLNNFASIELILDRNAFDVIKQIAIDLYAAVPFRSTLFGYKGGLVALPTLWQESIGLYGQIMPNVAQSYYYFGPLLCPVLSILLCYIGIISFNRADNIDNPCLYCAFIYLGLYSCVAITMYDFYIFMTMLLTRFLFMYLLSCFCKEGMAVE